MVLAAMPEHSDRSWRVFRCANFRARGNAQGAPKALVRSSPLDACQPVGAACVPLLSEAATTHSETFPTWSATAPAPDREWPLLAGASSFGGLMPDRIVPVAYVTKWATTAGIRIVRDGEATELGSLMKRGGLYVHKNHWTEDKAEAEARYRAQIDAARQSAERRAEKLEALYKAAPKYTEG